MPQEQPPLRKESLPIGSGPYSPQLQATNYTGYIPALRTSNWLWNSPLPTSSVGSSPWATVPGFDPQMGFHFNQETFRDTIQVAGDNPSMY